MKKQIIRRAAFGFPLGVAIGQCITIALSLFYGQGDYAPCVPALAAVMGSEISAVAVQTFLCGVLGTAFSTLSLIWQVESFSIAKQTGLYFFALALVYMPIAYFLQWMEHSFWGFMQYLGVFTAIFALIWLLQYARIAMSIKKMNARLK